MTRASHVAAPAAAISYVLWAVASIGVSIIYVAAVWLPLQIVRRIGLRLLLRQFAFR